MLLCVPTGVSSEVHQIQALQLLSLLLPEAHRETLRVNLQSEHRPHWTRPNQTGTDHIASHQTRPDQTQDQTR